MVEKGFKLTRHAHTVIGRFGYDYIAFVNGVDYILKFAAERADLFVLHYTAEAADTV